MQLPFVTLHAHYAAPFRDVGNHTMGESEPQKIGCICEIHGASSMLPQQHLPNFPHIYK